jgi:spermidine synthase
MLMSERLSRSLEFAFVGVASIFVQMIFMRRLIGLFGSSEILYALVLTIWLVQTGFWSWCADLWRSLSADIVRRRLALLYGLLAMLFLYYPCLGFLKGLFFDDYGPVPLSHVAIFSLAVLILPTLFPGMAFAALFRLRKLADSDATVGHAYLFDSLGFAIAGGALTLLFSVTGQDWMLILLLASVAVARFIKLGLGNRARAIAILAFSFLCIISVFFIGKSILVWYGDRAGGRESSDSYYYQIDESSESCSMDALSPYGHVRAVSDSLALNIYYNSQRVSTFPDPPTEELIAIPLAMCGDTGTVCIIGNSCDGKALFAAYDPTLDVIQVEPDPVLCNIFHSTLSGALASPGTADRFSLAHADPIDFLHGLTSKCDLIYINYSHVTSVAEGVFYNREFFELARSKLNPGGALAFSTQCGENFIQRERLEYIKNLYVTLAAVFPKTVILPGEYAMLIGGMEQSRLTGDANEILAASSAYRDHLTYISEAYLPDRLSEFRKQKLEALLAEIEGEEVTAAKPEQHLLTTILEMDKFAGIDSKILRQIRAMPGSITLAIAILPLIVPLGFAFARSKPLNLLVPAFFAGWWGLSSEILLMVLYQSIAGNLYSHLGLLVGLFMLGIAAGAWAGERVAQSQTSIVRVLKYMLISGMLIALAIGLLVPILLADFDRRTVVEYVIYGLAVVSGVVPGATFNLAVGRFAQLREKESPGRFYGADLFGAAIGGLVTTVLILPLLGIQAGFFVLAFSGLLVTLYSFARR